MSNTLKAVEAEATDVELTVEYGGESYQVPSPLDWPFDTLDHLSEGRMAPAIAGLLGEEQFATFKSTKPKVRDAVALMEQIAGASGVGELGN
ncbi:hypothetical protein ACFV0L_10390 [Streptosporangium canum]|uniref:hypothetical protein n=1 Tax=Streptosporangium canum TaxID=324952 RepID=UPI0036B7AB24